MARAILPYTQKIRKKLLRSSPMRSRGMDAAAILCGGAFLVGLVIGMILVRKDNNDLFRYLATAAEEQVIRCCREGLLYTAVTAIAARGLSMIFCAVMSNSSLGAPFLLGNLALCGIGLGLISGFYYKEFGFQGLLFNLLLVALPGALYGLAICSMSASGLRLSSSYFAAAFLHRGESGIDRAETDFLQVMPKSVVLVLLSGLLQGLFFLLFGSFVL